MRQIGEQANQKGYSFVVVGDKKSPDDFFLDNCFFLSLHDQLNLDFSFSKSVPVNHYSRKNIGYLYAFKNRATIISETDDDNYPYQTFFTQRERNLQCIAIEKNDWTNIYRYFYDSIIWPRGYPLDLINKEISSLDNFPEQNVDCPIQQDLADGNPDVDAIYRLLYQKKDIKFDRNLKIALGRGSWCPFNSQNTHWWPDAYLLLYLPSYCSFRMTDIWRSFVAQRIAWENNWHILFNEASVFQDRKEHDLMKDFESEAPGYINNRKLCKELVDIVLVSGKKNVPDNLIKCYEKLIDLNLVGRAELPLLELWIEDAIALLY